MDKTTQIGSLFFALIGVCALTVSFFAYRSNAEIATWPEVQGTVIDNGTHNKESFYELEWTGQDGEVRHMTVYGSTPARGTTRTLHLDPEDPQNASLDGGFPMPALVFAGIGFGFLGVSVRALWRGRSQEEVQEPPPPSPERDELPTPQPA